MASYLLANFYMSTTRVHFDTIADSIGYDATCRLRFCSVLEQELHDHGFNDFIEEQRTFYPILTGPHFAFMCFDNEDDAMLFSLAHDIFLVRVPEEGKKFYWTNIFPGRFSKYHGSINRR